GRLARPQDRSRVLRLPRRQAGADAMTALMRPLLAGLRVGDRIGKTVVGRIERLHFGGAVVASVARRDALLVGTQSVDDLGDGRRMAIGGIAAIGPVGVR